MVNRAPAPRAAKSRRASATELQLPHASDWRTTDQDEINRRILRAREERPAVLNLNPVEPVHSNFEVRSRSGIAYEVKVRDLAGRRFGCTCTDFQVNGLGTCKHVEAVLALLQAGHRKEFAAARRNGSRRIDLIPDPERQAIIVERNFDALPRPLRRWFDADGRMPAESVAEFQLNLQNASVVINCDLPWSPAQLEQRIARAWRKHQKNAVTVLNLIAADTIEQRMPGTLEAKRPLAEGVLDLKGDLAEVPLRPGGQSFLQRLEQTLSATPAAPAQSAAESPKRPPADPAAAFALRAAALLGPRLVACVERYPDTNDGAPPVLLVTVDRDAEAWQPRLAALQAELFASASAGAGVAPRLEVLDRATAQVLERLEAAGLFVSRVRATRQLQPAGTGTTPPLSVEEKARAATFRQQAAKKLRLARILAAEAVDALREAARLTGCAFAVEERVATMPATLVEAITPPLNRRWGEAEPQTRSLAENLGLAAPEAVEALQRVLEKAAAPAGTRG